jgi:condensin complex subunit 1
LAEVETKMGDHIVQFRFNQNIQDLEGKGVLDSAVERVDKLTVTEQENVLKQLRNQNPLDNDTINQLYSFIRYFWELPNEKLRKSAGEVLMKFIRDLYHTEDRTEADEDQNLVREKYKHYVYFLVFLIRDREKRDAEATAAGTLKKTKKKPSALASGDGEDDLVDLGEDFGDDSEDKRESKASSGAASVSTAWSAERDKYLEALLEVLWYKNQATDLGRVFDQGVPGENFLSLFWQAGELMLERGLTVVRTGSKTRELSLNLLAIPTCLFHDSVGHSIASSLWNLVRQHSHASTLVVDLLVLLTEQYQQDKLARDVIQQLGETDVTSVQKNIGSLVEEMAERMPNLLLSNLSLLLPYLNQKESYQMRCSIIRALPFLVSYLHTIKSGDNSESRTATRTKILETLADWSHDISPFVRAAVCSAWNHLVESRTLPLSHLLTALDLAIEAARDKKVLVRKNALSLLENLLATNPFGPDLSVELFVIEIERRKADLEEALQNEAEIDEQAAEMDDAEENDEPEQPSLLGVDDRRRSRKKERSTSKLRNEQVIDDEEEEKELPTSDTEKADEEDVGNPEDEAEPAPEETEQDKRKKVLVEALNFLKIAVMFIDKFESSIPYFCKLLTSKTDEDILGTIRLFATAQAFRLSGSDRGVRSMLKLIWNNKENGKVKKVLMETVERLYIAKTEGTKRLLFPAKVIANSLVDLAEGASLDELTSLGEVVSEMRKSAEHSCLKRVILPLNAVEELWSIILNHATNPARARVALCVLGMAASTTPAVVDDARSSTKLLEAIFAGRENTKQDFEMSKWGFHCVLVACKARGNKCMLPAAERKQIELHGVHLICGKWVSNTVEDRNAWFAASKAALDLIVEISDSPEKTLYFLLENLFEHSKSRNHADSLALSNLFFIAGHVSLKLLVLAERLVAVIKMSGKVKPAKEETKATTNGDEEEMLGATAEDDIEDQLLRQFAEWELVEEGSVFSCVLEWAQKLVLQGKIPSELRQCAVLCLCKLMSVSERVCEANLPLLFTVLRDAQEPETRSIIVISEGDLAFRFPNAIEPFTSNMYRSLRDPSVIVRKNSLMVLTHLALNDMIKVRGEVAEIAMRLEDDDRGVRDLARFFFAELSKRGTNPIYNLLPDILGTLSRESPQALGPNKFRNLAKFLLEFVDKDKQCEALADKLCHRIHTTCGNVGDIVVPSHMPEEFQICRDLCYCLEQLKLSDALLKRLNDDSDLFKCIRPILGDSTVYLSLTKLTAKASPKSQEAKRTLEELMAKMEKLHQQQSQDIAAFDKANQKSRGKNLKVSDSKVGLLLDEAIRQQQELLEQQQLEQDENSSKNKMKKKPVAASKAAATKKRTAIKAKKYEDEDNAEASDDLDESENEIAEVVPKKSSRAAGNRKKNIVNEDDE